MQSRWSRWLVLEERSHDGRAHTKVLTGVDNDMYNRRYQDNLHQPGSEDVFFQMAVEVSW